MEGTGRNLYIAEVDPEIAEDIEKQLIFENQPKYNKNGKINPPEISLNLIHQGNSPKFFE